MADEQDFEIEIGVNIDGAGAIPKFIKEVEGIEVADVKVNVTGTEEAVAKIENVVKAKRVIVKTDEQIAQAAQQAQNRQNNLDAATLRSTINLTKAKQQYKDALADIEAEEQDVSTKSETAHARLMANAAQETIALQRKIEEYEQLAAIKAKVDEQRAYIAGYDEENASRKNFNALSDKLKRNEIPLNGPQDAREYTPADIEAKLAEQRQINKSAEQDRAYGQFEYGNVMEGIKAKSGVSIDPSSQKSGTMAEELEKQRLGWEHITPQILAGKSAYSALNNELPETIRNMHGFGDELVRHISTFAIWSAASKLVQGGEHFITKGLGDAIHSEKEQNITGQYYAAATGKEGSFTPTMSDTTMNAAINMARVYGTEVTHVQENIGLWAKVTKGQLAPAITLADQAMQLNAVSGMNMEEIYRSTIAVFGQLQEPLSRVNDLYNIGVGLALKYGGGIQSLGGESQDAVAQMIEGMTRLSAIMVEGLGKGPDTLAKIGAQVAVVSQLTNESGDAVAGHLAAAFAKIEAGKLREALHGIGVETRDNSNLIEDLGTHWAKALPIIQAGGVRSQDLEFVKTLIDNYKLYAQAVADAKEAEKNAAADKSFNELQKTTDQQLKDMKAGFEAVSITTMREFLPQIKGVVEAINNGLVPALLSNKEGLLLVGQQVAVAAIALGGFQLAVFGISSVIRVWDAISTTMVRWSATTDVAMTAARTELGSYQLAALDLLSVSGKADSEMISSVKLLAAQHNLSIDSMIFKLKELQLQEGVVTTAVEEANLRMAGSAETLASKTGLEMVLVKGELTGLEEKAAFTAAAVGRSFMEMIPVIGGVIALAMTAWDVSQWVNKTAHDHDEKELGTNQAYRMGRREENNRRLGVKTQQLLEVSGPHGERAHSPKAEQLNHEIDDLIADNARLKELGKTGYLTPEQIQTRDYNQNLQGVLDRYRAEAAKERATSLKNLYAAPKTSGGAEEDPAKKAAKEKGIESQAGQDAYAVRQISTEYENKAKAIAEDMRIGEQQINQAHRLLTIFGDTTDGINRLKTAMQQKMDLDRQGIKNDDTEAGLLKAQGLRDYRDQQKFKPNSTQYTALGNDMLSVDRQLQTLHDRSVGYRADIENQYQALFDITANAANHAVTEAVKGIDSALSIAQTNLSRAKTPEAADQGYLASQAAKSKALADYNAQENIVYMEAISHVRNLTKDELALIQTIEEKKAKLKEVSAEQRDAEAIDESTKQKIDDLKLSMLDVFDKPMQDLIRATASEQKEYNTEVVKLKDAGDVAGIAQLNNWKALTDSINLAKYAQAQYVEDTKALQNTLGFKIMEDATKTIGKTVGESIYNDLNPDKKAGLQGQQQALQARITQLESEKNLLQGVRYNGQRMDIDKQIANLKLEEQRLKDQENKKPSLVRQVVQDAEKSVIDATIKKYSDNLKTMVTEAFLGPAPKDALTKQSDAMKELQTKLTAIIKDDPSSFFNSTQLLQTIFAQFHTDALSLQGGGTGGIANSVNGGTSAFPMVNIPGFKGTNFSSLLGSLGTSNGALGTEGAMTAMGALAASQSGSGGGQGGILGFLSANKGNIAKGIGGISGLAAGFSTGGLQGGIEAGSGMAALLPLLLHGGAAAGPWGIGLAAAAGLAATLIHHDDPSKMPDKYQTQDFGQFAANFNGGNATANGQQFSFDSSISATTGGKSEGQFIHDYLAGKTDAQLASVFGSQAAAIKNEYGGWDSRGLHDGKNGNLMVGDKTFDWKTLQTDGTTAFNAITAAANNLNQALAPLISVNAYGAAGASFSPYYTPGYGDVSSLYNTPYGVPSAMQPQTANSYVAPPSGGSTTRHTSVVNLDGRTVAKVVSNYRSQTIQQGFQADS